MPRKYWPIQLLLAVVWFVTGYFAFSPFGPQAGFYGAIFNLILGSILILIVNRSESASKRLYEGEAAGGLHLGLLMLAAIPTLCIVAGAAWWLLRFAGLLR